MTVAIRRPRGPSLQLGDQHWRPVTGVPTACHPTGGMPCAGRISLSRNRISVRGVAIAASTAVAVGALTVGVNAWAGEPTSHASAAQAMPAAAELGTMSLPSKHLADVAAAKHQAELKRQAQLRRQAELRRQAIEAARRARAALAAKERASRSAVRTVTVSGDPRSIARQLASSKYGWGASQFSCLDSLWGRESGWNVHAQNSSSGAYGIPQALPGSKMSAYGPDWQNNAATQIKWGLNYIQGRYGSPCSALSTQQSQGWY